MRFRRNADGNSVALEGTFQDITERKKMEEILRQSEAALVEAQRLAHLGSWEWDLNTGKVWWSEETYRIYGLEPGAFVPSLKKLEEAFHPDDRYMIKMITDEAYREAKPYDFEHRIVRPDGEVRWVYRQATVIRGPDGEPLRLIGTNHDVTQRNALEERLEHQAFHDHLTGLPNRHLFVDRLKQVLKRNLRRGGKVAVLFLDLDGFKVVNDSLGHEAGDKLLIKVAQRLKDCLRSEDTFARFGGDEFTILIGDTEESGEAVRVAERIITQFRTPFLLEGRDQFLSASIGIALGDALTKAPEDLLRGADTAMYRAKEERSGYQVFVPSMQERAVDRLGLENDLRKAVEAGAGGREFVLHYQPIVDLQSGETRRVEALVRWEHPTRGLLGPLNFIPLAEETDLIVPLGRWVLEESCRQAREWNEWRPGQRALAVSVNVSARQLCRPELAETVEGVLKQSGLEPGLLILEVTESAMLEAGAEDKEVLDRLKSLGVRLSIDDFGTGYSSLSYLRRFPADVLKIDKSFVWNLGGEPKDTAIVETIIELAHVLGMEVVGEGVEEAGTEMLLREMGCDFAQGFYFSKPQPPDEIEGFLTS
jgi:diguanylate cyclase (GGDEF)-like protein/PAS domain S-box-containing protein